MKKTPGNSGKIAKLVVSRVDVWHVKVHHDEASAPPCA